MTRRIIQLLVICSLSLAAATANAAGFALYEFSARGNALGGAVMARKADPSSIAFNPAQITQLEGTQFAIGASGVYPAATVNVDGTDYDGKSSLWVLPHFYATTQINEKWYAGVGGFSRFGLGTEFDSDWAGRYDTYYARIRSFSVNPVLGYKITDKLSVAAGPEIMWFEFKSKTKKAAAIPPSPASDLDARVEGDSYGVGGSFGIHYQFTDWLAAGASYRTEIKQTLKGDTEVSGIDVKVDAEGSVILPQQVAFGVSIKPTDKLSIEAGAVWTGWSSYSGLTIENDDPLSDTSKTTDYKNVWRYNIGVEYSLTPNWDLRASYVYDNSPINSSHLNYLIPANDRQIFGGGVGWHNENWSIDASYSYLYMKDRHGTVNTVLVETPLVVQTQDTTFKDCDAHIFGLTVGYKF